MALLVFCPPLDLAGTPRLQGVAGPVLQLGGLLRVTGRGLDGGGEDLLTQATLTHIFPLLLSSYRLLGDDPGGPEDPATCLHRYHPANAGGNLGQASWWPASALICCCLLPRPSRAVSPCFQRVR